MDHVEIWDKAKALLREELANVSYTTWIDQPLKPVYVVDDKLALEVISEFTEKTIRARYLSMITEAVSQVVGREMSVELMSVKERIAWQESQKKEEQAPLQGIIDYLVTPFHYLANVTNLNMPLSSSGSSLFLSCTRFSAKESNARITISEMLAKTNFFFIN